MIAVRETDPPELIETILDRRARRHTGLAVGVLRDGEAWTVGRGRIASPGSPPPRADTIFEIGSVTKVFTATVLADMVEEGLVRLDEPVQRLLPETVALPVRGRPMALLDLATHTSGLPRLPKGMLRRGLRERENPYASFGPADLDRAIREARLRRAPGTKLRYSNFGMGLLGHVLALRAGVAYEQLVRERICDPLGLVDTRIAVPSEAASRFADGHDRRGREVPTWDLPTLAGAGALRSTVSDLLRFLELQLAPPPTRLGRAAARTHAPLARRRRLGQCLGWMVLEGRSDEERVHWHDGGTGGFRSFVGFSAHTSTGVVVLANCTRWVNRVGFALLEDLGRRR